LPPLRRSAFGRTDAAVATAPPLPPPPPPPTPDFGAPPTQRVRLYRRRRRRSVRTSFAHQCTRRRIEPHIPRRSAQKHTSPAAGAIL